MKKDNPQNQKKEIYKKSVERSPRLSKKNSQLGFNIERKKEKDRNFSKGGRSFYFFDFDDNIAILSSGIFIFHKETGKEYKLTSEEYANQQHLIGKQGPLKDYQLRFDDETGSFRNFRDAKLSWLDRLLRKKQCFVEDVLEALNYPDFHWKGPSWDCFYHAVYNLRPVSLITARGHHPETIKKGIEQWVRYNYLPQVPNYLSIYPVSHSATRETIGKAEASVAELKQSAIRASVYKAFETYGKNPYHRFGMSDDDPKNIKLILEEMKKLKKEFPENSFFVIETHKGKFVKKEIFADHLESHKMTATEQLHLFDLDDVDL